MLKETTGAFEWARTHDLHIKIQSKPLSFNFSSWLKLVLFPFYFLQILKYNLFSNLFRINLFVMHEYACFSSWASSCECSVVDSCEKVNRMFVVSHVWLSLSEVWSRERCECIKKIVVMCKIANIVYRIRKFRSSFIPRL